MGNKKTEILHGAPPQVSCEVRFKLGDEVMFTIKDQDGADVHYHGKVYTVDPRGHFFSETGEPSYDILTEEPVEILFKHIDQHLVEGYDPARYVAATPRAVAVPYVLTSADGHLTRNEVEEFLTSHKVDRDKVKMIRLTFFAICAYPAYYEVGVKDSVWGVTQGIHVSAGEELHVTVDTETCGAQPCYFRYYSLKQIEIIG